jgi:hypothetical protein
MEDIWIDFIEINWVEAYALFMQNKRELSCSCRILASPTTPPQLLDYHPNHQEGITYLEQEEVEPPHGVGVQGDNGAPSQSCGGQRELREVVWEVANHHLVAVRLAGEQVDNACMQQDTWI